LLVIFYYLLDAKKNITSAFNLKFIIETGGGYQKMEHKPVNP
jgi:hypothetical protein